MTAETPPWEELFVKANQAYRADRFQEAVDGYQQLLQSGDENGHLYYNLGNAYLRLNDLGRAILNYERAHLLIPRDADLDFNLRFARDQLEDAVAPSRGFIGRTFFWLNSMNLDELSWVFAVLNVLFWGCLLAKLFIRSEWIYYGLILLLVFWGITGLSFGLKWYQLETDDRAVILQPELNVLAGPDPQDTILFKLHAGTMVQVERSEDGWALVRLPDKKRGWVENDSMEGIILDFVE
jgi:tetratricopeptide (TPR) repeat protein